MAAGLPRRPGHFSRLGPRRWGGVPDGLVVDITSAEIRRKRASAATRNPRNVRVFRASRVPGGPSYRQRLASLSAVTEMDGFSYGRDADASPRSSHVSSKFR